MAAYNRQHATTYQIKEIAFPKAKPYGWNNYPYDYWNIWVKNAGDQPFREEPTLEMLARDYTVIIFKHCYPVSAMRPDTGRPAVESEVKTLENYKMQYMELRTKMRSFPQVRFIVWTPAALVEAKTNEGQARRAADFADWMRKTWDERDDNIFLWDFHALETEGGLYLKPEFAAGPQDSHPGSDFSRQAAPKLVQRIVDVIEGFGDRQRQP